MTAAETPSPVQSGVGSWRTVSVRYLICVAALMCLFYAVIYFPYQSGLRVRALFWYLRLLTSITGATIKSFDNSARVVGDSITGRFSLRIVLDCAALDAQSLLAAAVLAFPAPWLRKTIGLVIGTAIVGLVNITRIAFLYLVGLRWPASFAILHEEVLQFAIILATFLTFIGWVRWTLRTRET